MVAPVSHPGLFLWLVRSLHAAPFPVLRTFTEPQQRLLDLGNSKRRLACCHVSLVVVGKVFSTGLQKGFSEQTPLPGDRRIVFAPFAEAQGEGVDIGDTVIANLIQG